MKYVFRVLLALALSLPAFPAQAAQSLRPVDNKLIEIPPGMTTADLTDDGKPEIILKAWRENFNAYGYYVIQFLEGPDHAQPLTGREKIERSADGFARGSPYEIIGIDETTGDASFQHELLSFGGADCAMHDYRLVFKNKKTYLIEADIPETKTVCNEDFVNFQIFDLTTNEEGIAGSTFLYFEPFKQWISSSKFTDVTKAFHDNEQKLITMIQ